MDDFKVGDLVKLIRTGKGVGTQGIGKYSLLYDIDYILNNINQEKIWQSNDIISHFAVKYKEIVPLRNKEYHLVGKDSFKKVDLSEFNEEEKESLIRMLTSEDISDVKLAEEILKNK